MGDGARVLWALWLWGAVLAVSGCGGGGSDSGLPPTVRSLDPSSAVTHSEAFQLHVEGGVFPSDSVVAWNATPLATTFVSDSDLLATVPASELSTPGQAL